VGVGDGVLVGVGVSVEVGEPVAVVPTVLVPPPPVPPGHGWEVGYCATMTTHATAVPAVLRATPTPTHLNGGDEGVHA